MAAVNGIEFTALTLSEGGRADVGALRAGQGVYLSGTVYTARDAAHARFAAALAEGKPLPVNPAAVYYAGPSPARPGEIIGSCGPTSSIRMEKYAPLIIERGQYIIIGKGNLGAQTAAALKKAGGVYLLATGGAAALIKKHITACKAAAYPELGCEAVFKLQLDRLPLLVGIDSLGNTILR